MKREKTSGRSRTRTLLFCLFTVLFLASAAYSAVKVYSNYKADHAIRQLRSQIQDSRTAEDSGALQSASPAGTEKKGPSPAGETSGTEKAEPEAPRRLISMDFTPLLEINEETVAWLSADGLSIDYPVLRAEDNDYYLNHMYNREVNSHGSLFVDYRNHGDFSDRNTFIYGHHMGDGSMFGCLDEYISPDFISVVPTMTLRTPEGDYRIELICGTVEDGNEDFMEFNFETEEAFQNYVNTLRARSTFQSSVELQPGDRLVSLCTCNYSQVNARYMLVGRLVELYEE